MKKDILKAVSVVLFLVITLLGLSLIADILPIGAFTMVGFLIVMMFVVGMFALGEAQQDDIFWKKHNEKKILKGEIDKLRSDIKALRDLKYVKTF